MVKPTISEIRNKLQEADLTAAFVYSPRLDERIYIGCNCFKTRSTIQDGKRAVIELAKQEQWELLEHSPAETETVVVRGVAPRLTETGTVIEF